MTDEGTVLVPKEEHEIDFQGDTLFAVKVDTPQGELIYVPLKPITDALGLDWSAQYRRVQRDAVLSEEMELIAVTAIKSEPGRGNPQAVCLPEDYLQGWLFGISANRVKRELRADVIRYQRECHIALRDYFRRKQLSKSETADSMTLAEVRSLGLALVRLAEEQMQLDGRVSVTENRLDRAALIVRELGQRVEQLEERVSPTARVTEEQASEIAIQVKALAQLLTERDSSRNHFAGVYSELYRRFGVSSYKNIRQDRYEEVLTFLEGWRGRVAGG